MNAVWHERNLLGRTATLDERVAWHVEHARACGCRPIPAGVAALILDRGDELPDPPKPTAPLDSPAAAKPRAKDR